MSHKKVSEVKSAGLGFSKCVETRFCRVKGITVSTGKAFYIPARQDLVYAAASAAVAIGDKNLAKVVMIFSNESFELVWNFIGVVVQLSVKALNRNVIPCIIAFEPFNLSCEFFLSLLVLI